MKKEVTYNEIANNTAITTESKKAKLQELKEMQEHLEESRQVWRKQHPQRLEFLSIQEMEEEKSRRKDAAKWQKVVVPKDLPVLQLAGGYKWDPKKVVHNSAAAFIRAFEHELHAHDLSVDEHWQRLLSRSLNDPQYLWLKGQLATCDGEVTWERVTKMITEKYDTQVQNYRAMRRVVRLQQGQNESIDAYILKFQQLSLEAEMPTGLLLIIIFLSSLQPTVGEQALLAIVNQYGRKMPEDLEEVGQLVSGLKITDVGERRTREDDSHNDNQHGAKKYKPSKPKSCFHCKRQWKPGHRCQEFFDNKSKHKPFVNRAARLNQADEQIDTLPCKSYESIKQKESDEILTPIIVEEHKIKALLDTGANFSALDISFVKSTSIKYEKVYGSITFASSGVTIPRIGITAPLKVTYKGKVYQRQFEIMELPRKHPMCIGTDFMFELGIGYTGLATSWDTPAKSLDDESNHTPYEPGDAPAGTAVEMLSFQQAIQKDLENNAKIPPGAFCNIPESIIELNTPEGVSCYRRQYEFPLTRRKIVKETVEQWEKEGTIKEVPANIDNRWNSPLTFAPKKDATGKKVCVRLCLDPRHINRHLPDDRYPLPLIRNIFQQLAGSTVFSTLDLKSAFHRFLIHPKDQHKTTFTSVDGRQYMFVGCPFGLKPISAKCQRVMQILFAGLPFVTTFVDDIVIYSRTLKDHVHHVRITLDRLTKANLLLNPNKCHFAQRVVYLLGFRVSAHGVALDSRKVTNVLEWPTPVTGKDIQRFLGIVNYFRDHIPNVARLTAKLDALRHAGNLRSLWTSAHDVAFRNIKYAVSHAPMLRHVDLRLPFHLATDASNEGIGAVLYQQHNGQNNIVGFMARALSKSERNYSVTKRELLAIVFALKKFHKFLWGMPFTLYTDHKALMYLHRQKDPSPMMIQWLDTLLDYQFKVVYLPGISNILPDHLSRLFSTPTQSLEGGDNDTNNIRIMRAVDLVDMLQPPESERRDILEKAHLFGHFGAEAIVRAVHNNGIHWPSMKQQAIDLIRACKECQKYNIAQNGYNPLRPIRAYVPGDHWAIDLAGPMTTTQRGNNYLLVLVDICTRFCILRPISDKQSHTIVATLIQVFCDFGLPRILQSDNGTEFVNQLMQHFKRAAGFDHRLVTPYHPRANGVAERWVQSSIKAIKKRVQRVHKDWDIYVPAVQLALNAKVSTRLNTPPFSLKFYKET